MSHRKLIRPDLSEQRASRGVKRKVSPPDQTNAEEFYYLKQMAAKTPMVVVLTNDEELQGWIEWYDRGSIKLNRTSGPNLLIPKHNIRYMYKEEELKRFRRKERNALRPRGERGEAEEAEGVLPVPSETPSAVPPADDEA
jgi:host factor-I protein